MKIDSVIRFYGVLIAVSLVLLVVLIIIASTPAAAQDFPWMPTEQELELRQQDNEQIICFGLIFLTLRDIGAAMRHISETHWADEQEYAIVVTRAVQVATTLTRLQQLGLFTYEEMVDATMMYCPRLLTATEPG